MNSWRIVELMSEEVAKVIIAFTTLTGVMFTAWLAYQGKKNAKDVNDAVNHRHPDQPRLIDYVVRNDQRIDVLVDMVNKQAESMGECSRKIDLIAYKIDAHDKWIREREGENG